MHISYNTCAPVLVCLAGGDETSNAPSRGSDRAERGRGRGGRGGRAYRGGRGKGSRGASADSKGRLLQYPSVLSCIAGKCTLCCRVLQLISLPTLCTFQHLFRYEVTGFSCLLKVQKTPIGHKTLSCWGRLCQALLQHDVLHNNVQQLGRHCIFCKFAFYASCLAYSKHCIQLMQLCNHLSDRPLYMLHTSVNIGRLHSDPLLQPCLTSRESRRSGAGQARLTLLQGRPSKHLRTLQKLQQQLAR